jgi:hypothetical protein
MVRKRTEELELKNHVLELAQALALFEHVPVATLRALPRQGARPHLEISRMR